MPRVPAHPERGHTDSKETEARPTAAGKLVFSGTELAGKEEEPAAALPPLRHIPPDPGFRNNDHCNKSRHQRDISSVLSFTQIS